MVETDEPLDEYGLVGESVVLVWWSNVEGRLGRAVHVDENDRTAAMRLVGLIGRKRLWIRTSSRVDRARVRLRCQILFGRI